MTAFALPEKALASAVQELPDNPLAPSRKAALARFLDRGFPTTRLEDWKYTDLSKIADISQRWLENGAPAPTAAAIDTVVVSCGRGGKDRFPGGTLCGIMASVS
jgi:hypothetical protein